MTGRLRLDALAASGPYRTHSCITVHDVRGQPAADMSVAPRLFIHRSLAALRSARGTSADDRVAALARAGRAFANGTIHGLSAAEYQNLVSRVPPPAPTATRSWPGPLAR